MVDQSLKLKPIWGYLLSSIVALIGFLVTTNSDAGAGLSQKVFQHNVNLLSNEGLLPQLKVIRKVNETQ